MISIGHFSSIQKKKLVCSYQLIDEFTTNNFAVMNITRQLGKSSETQYHDISEILALASIEPNHRSHVVAIEKSGKQNDVLTKWRSKFKNIKNEPQEPFISDLLSLESKLYDQQTIYDETMIIENYTIDSSVKINDDKHLLYSFMKRDGKILGFRTKRSDEHLDEIVSLADKHEVAIYGSNYHIDNNHYRSNKTWHPLSHAKKGAGLIIINESDVNITKIINDDNEPSKSLKVDQYDHIICPYCERTFTKRFALTNHINATHKESVEDYINAYK